ncbi:hypothetical protein GP486_004768 [Trichoglossum hirsutum]|uniref:RRM domain-containing protein n=1 Tax=Trichoglossum hirsutum TaxID=265104 RepID=A0A9P8RP28_9PEZI|nr:hypothetical protein GP486_004768 [Trichoglossum hirsutum]
MLKRISLILLEISVEIEAINQPAVSSSTAGNEGRDASTRISRPPGNTDGPALAPTRHIFVANMLFDVTADDLKTEMEQFGEVLSSKIATKDGRSRGFGYVEFSKQEDATRAREELHGQVFGGRVLIVNYARRVRDSETVNPPSNTLYVGNLPYEMSDDDLHKLFGQFDRCVDVRVPVDRRTGVPRGFLHAEFIDVDSAQAAYDMLKEKEFLGRKLKVDYTNTNERQEAFGRRRRMKHIEQERNNGS